MKRSVGLAGLASLLAAATGAAAQEALPAPASTVVCVASSDGGLTIYDPETRVVLLRRAFPGRVTSLAALGLGASTLQALLPDEDAIGVYDLRAHRVVETFPLPASAAQTTRFLASGPLFGPADSALGATGTLLVTDRATRTTTPIVLAPDAPDLVAPTAAARLGVRGPQGQWQTHTYVLDQGASRLVHVQDDGLGPRLAETAPVGATETFVATTTAAIVVVAGAHAPRFLFGGNLLPVDGATDLDLGTTVDLEAATAEPFVYALNAELAGDSGGAPGGQPSIDVYGADGRYRRSIGLGPGGPVRAMTLHPDGARAFVVRETPAGDAGEILEVTLASGSQRAPVPLAGVPTDALVVQLPLDGAAGFVRIDTVRPLPDGRVAVTGAVDVGDRIGAYLGESVAELTVASGSWGATVPLERRGETGTWRSRDPAVDLTIRVRDPQTSAATFRLLLPSVAQGGPAPWEGHLPLRMRPQSGLDALGVVRLDGGRYHRARRIGAHAFPFVFPEQFASRRPQFSPGLVHLRGGFATDGTVPAAMGEVTFSIDVALYRIPGAAFVRRGSVFTYRDRNRDPQLVTFDFHRGRFELRGHRQYFGSGQFWMQIESGPVRGAALFLPTTTDGRRYDYGGP